jgi:hypothetical protein
MAMIGIGPDQASLHPISVDEKTWQCITAVSLTNLFATGHAFSISEQKRGC